MSVLDKIRGFVSNPFVTGILGAAAIGANPLVGLIAGPAIKNSRERNELENEALRAELKAFKRQGAAMDRLPGVLAGLDMGHTNPITGEPMTGDEPGFGVDPADAQRGALMGVLSEIAPRETSATILGQLFPSAERVPADLKILEAMGVDPKSPEGRKLLEGSMSRGGEDVLGMILSGLQIKELQGKLADTAEDRAREEAGRSLNAQNVFGSAFALLDANDALRGTKLETGSSFSSVARGGASAASTVGGLFGADTSGIDESITQLDLFNKHAADLGTNLVSSVGSSDAGFRQFMLQANPSAKIRPDANEDVVLKMIERTIRQIEAEGTKVDGLDEVKAELKRRKEAAAQRKSGDLTPAEQAELRRREELERLR